MSIKPIDLQTLFSQINHVGKDQAFQKEALLMQQVTTGKEIAEKTLQKDEVVNQTSVSSDGPQHVEDEDGQDTGRHHSGNKRKQPEQEKKKQVFKDPDLGAHIDIEG